MLITLDTLRRDHLGCYGHFRDTSPRLDALARASIVFDRAVATSANTLPSHVSIMTALYAHQHGVQGNLPPDASATDDVARATVASALASSGYDTAAFVSALVVGPQTGIEAGFATFDAPEDARRTGEATVQRAIRWLDARQTDAFFLWVHLFDAHEPNTPSPMDTAWTGDTERQDREVDARRIRPDVLQSSESKGSLCRFFFPDLLDELADDQGLELPPVDRARVHELLDRYDGDVRATDECVGRILDALRRHGSFESAIVAVVADHGQSLGQHDWLTHGRITNDNVVVPMLLRIPGETPRRVGATVSIVDLVPTVLARIGGVSFGDVEGRDALAPEFLRASALAQESVLRARPGHASPAFALIGDRWRYVRESGVSRLYDLSTDPAAYDDVAAAHPAIVAECAAELERTLARRRAPESNAPPVERPALEQALRQLGYTGD